jgi:dTDP-glucose 4,6-dehydratase
MKIVITGGCGFIGSNFVRHWRTTHPEDEIVVLDKLTYAGHKENLHGLDIALVEGDICDPNAVAEALGGAEVVVHFAAESHVDRSIAKPSVFVQANVVGTQVLLEEACRQKIKLFHHVSTDEVFGSLPLESPEIRFDEETRYAPHSPYAASKAASDHLVRAYHDTYGLPITITNTSNNYGPYQDPEKLIPRFITNLLTGSKVPLMGRGENVRDWCYVEDHCEAIERVIQAALRDPKIVGETFCVGGNSEKSNKEVTLELLHLFGKDESWIEHIPHRLGHDTRYAINSSKINRVLGWSPSHDFGFWLKKTVSWYQENESWWKPLRGAR